jgi:hypothetical protein
MRMSPSWRSLMHEASICFPQSWEKILGQLKIFLGKVRFRE